LRKVDQNGLGKGFQVILDSVLHDVIDVDDQLLEFDKAVVYVVEVAVNVHGSPGECYHTRSELVFEVFKMGHEKGFGVGTDLGNDSLVLLENVLELVVVHFELVFLEEDDLGRLRDVNSDTGETLGFSDECEDFGVEVDVELVVVRVSDDEGCLKTCLGSFYLNCPFLLPEVLVVEDGVANLVVGFNMLLAVFSACNFWREVLHWS